MEAIQHFHPFSVHKTDHGRLKGYYTILDTVILTTRKVQIQYETFESMTLKAIWITFAEALINNAIFEEFKTAIDDLICQ